MAYKIFELDKYPSRPDKRFMIMSSDQPITYTVDGLNAIEIPYGRYKLPTERLVDFRAKSLGKLTIAFTDADIEEFASFSWQKWKGPGIFHQLIKGAEANFVPSGDPLKIKTSEVEDFIAKFIASYDEIKTLGMSWDVLGSGWAHYNWCLNLQQDATRIGVQHSVLTAGVTEQAKLVRIQIMRHVLSYQVRFYADLLGTDSFPKFNVFYNFNDDGSRQGLVYRYTDATTFAYKNFAEFSTPTDRLYFNLQPILN